MAAAPAAASGSAPDAWTVRSMLAWCEGYLGRHGDPAPRRSAETLVGAALGLERIGLYLDLDRPLEPSELDTLRDSVRRRGTGEPLQYITGTAPFRYLEVKVAPGVLIPRPETEVLASEALALLPPARKPQDDYDEVLLEALGVRPPEGGGGRGDDGPSAEAPEESAQPSPVAKPQAAGAARPGARAELLVADICTGTGCIACSIATEHPGTRVIATDLAPEAVTLARENVRAAGVEDAVEVVECDLGAGVPADLMGTFDLVVSNPPYIPSAVLRDIPREVADFEPALALDGGADGLALYRRLVAWALEALKPGGGFACELHETCLDQAAAIAARAGYRDIRIVDDLAGRPRVIVARTPGE